MRIKNIVALCSMMMLTGATTIGANAQETVVQLNTVGTPVIQNPNILLAPNTVLLTRTESAIIPATDPTADIHTPSLLPMGTLAVHGINSCDTAIILPGMADMPSAQLIGESLQMTRSAVVLPVQEPAPVVLMKKITTKKTTVTTKVFRRTFVHHACMRVFKRPACRPVRKACDYGS